MQADGTEKGYNYVSVPPQVLAGYPAVLDIIKPSLLRSSPNPFRSHRRQPVLCLRSRPSLSKIRRVRISLVAGCFTSKMKLLAREEWGKQQSLLLTCPLFKEKLTSLTLTCLAIFQKACCQLNLEECVNWVKCVKSKGAFSHQEIHRCVLHIIYIFIKQPERSIIF